jgi:hypothetical protein
MKLTKSKLKQIIKEELSKALSEDETSTELNSHIAAHFTQWFAQKAGTSPIHRDRAPQIAQTLAKDLRAGKFSGGAPEEQQQEYREHFNNLADTIEKNPLLAHWRKLGKRGDWYAVATGAWDESQYRGPYSHPDDNYNYGWEGDA